MEILTIAEVLNNMTSFLTYRDLFQLRLCNQQLHKDTGSYSFTDHKLLEFAFRYKYDLEKIDEIKKDYWKYVKEEQSLADKRGRKPFFDFIKIISFPFLHQEDLDADVLSIATENRLSLYQTIPKLLENIKYDYQRKVSQYQIILRDTDHFMYYLNSAIWNNYKFGYDELCFIFMTRSLSEVKNLVARYDDHHIADKLLLRVALSSNLARTVHHVCANGNYWQVLKIRPELTDDVLKCYNSIMKDRLMHIILHSPPIALAKIFDYDLEHNANDNKLLIRADHIKSIANACRADVLSLIWYKYQDVIRHQYFAIDKMIEAAPFLAGSIYNKLQSCYSDINQIPLEIILALIKAKPVLATSIVPSLIIDEMNIATKLVKVCMVEGQKIVIDKYANHDNDIAWIFAFIYHCPEISEYIWEKYKYKIQDNPALSNIYEIFDSNLELAKCVNLYEIISQEKYSQEFDKILMMITNHNNIPDMTVLEKMLSVNRPFGFDVNGDKEISLLLFIMKYKPEYSKLVVNHYMQDFDDYTIRNFVIKNPEFFNIIYDKVPYVMQRNIIYITHHNPKIFNLFLAKCSKKDLLYDKGLLSGIISRPSCAEMTLKKYPDMITAFSADQLVKHDPSLIREVFSRNPKLSLEQISNILHIVPDFATNAVKYCREHHIAATGEAEDGALANIMEHYMLQQIQDLPLLM